MKKIAFVRHRYLPPSETFIYEELKNIRRFKPIVFTRKKMNSSRFPYPRITRLPRRKRNIIKAFKKRKIKLIHARFGHAGVRLMKVKRKLRIPMITSFHGFDLPLKRKKRKSYHRKLPRLFKISDKLTVPSMQMKKKLIRWGCPSYKINIMYSGIDLKKFPFIERNEKKDRITIIAVGRLHKKKGFPYLLKAFRKVRAAYPSTRLIIVGEGPERKKLKRLISKLKLKKHVRLKGLAKHSELPGLLHDADIFCLPSITTSGGNQEGIPNAIKEAMATGLPIVSTYHGGIPELVTDGQHGFLVHEKKATQLANKIKVLIEYSALRREMGERGRAKVEREFDSAKQVKKLEDLYTKLIKKGRR